MAKKQDEQPQQTMEDFLLAQLQEEVIAKDGTQLKAAIKREQCQTCLSIAEREQARPKGKAADGHVMTKQVRATFTQGGGLRRGCGVKMAA